MATDLVQRPTETIAEHDTHDAQAVAEIMERVIAAGDLADLTVAERNTYYLQTCKSLGLNPLTRPFEYISLNDRLTLYARRDATDQLRRVRGISVEIVSRELSDGIYVVTARGTTPDGRSDESVGAVPLVKEGGHWEENERSGRRFFKADGTYAPLKPDDRANAMMKAETKAKRRVTLSVCGLGFLDETETETIASARRVLESPDPGAHEALAADRRERLTAGAGAATPARPAAEPERLDATPEPEPLAGVDLYAQAEDEARAAAVTRYQAAYDRLAAMGVKINGDREPNAGSSPAQIERWAGALEADLERREGKERKPEAAADGPPATPTQVETIAKLARSLGREVPTAGISRAAASELLTRLSEERYSKPADKREPAAVG